MVEVIVLPLPVLNTALDIEPVVADQLNRCAITAGLSVSTLLRALLAVQAPRPMLGDLVRTARYGRNVYQVHEVSADGTLFLGAAHSLHSSDCVMSAGWTPPSEITRVEPTDR